MYRVSRQITLHNRSFFSTLKRDSKAIKKSYHLTAQQKKFVEWESLGDCKLLGISGSGKTLSILHRVKHLIEQRAYKPEEFHILTFSRLTRLDIMNKIQLHDFSNLPSDNVKTMDALARAVLKDLGRNYKDAALLSLNFLNLLEQEFDIARPYLENLKYMFIDEAQDLRDAHIRIANILREKNNSRVCVVGDPCQSIYQFLGCDPSFLMNFAGESFQLTKNFRSTPNIICFSEHFRKKDVFEYPIEHSEALDSKENVTKNHKKKREVEIYIGTSKQVEQKILREISKYTKEKSNIGILSPLAKSKFSDNVGLSWAANLLTKNRVPFIKQYKDSGMPWRGDPYTKPEYVNLTTYTGSKGLEWDFVVLLDFSLFKHGTLPTQKEYLEDLNLYYVATTRAKTRLLICHKTDTGLNDEIVKPNDEPIIELKPAEPTVDVKDILGQFKEAVQPLMTIQESHIENLREEKSEEDEEEDEEELRDGNMRIIRNMPHPLIKTVDPELYESTERTKSRIKRLKFDITWLEKEKRIEGPLTVSEFVSSLDKEKIGDLFQNPQFELKHEKESVYEKKDMNLAAIQNNEALAGIISENLLYRYLGLPIRDLVEPLAKQSYKIHYNHQKYVDPPGGNSSADADKKIKYSDYDEFSLIRDDGYQQSAFPKQLYVSPSAHRAILSSLKSIKQVNDYKTDKEKKDNDSNADFHTVFNSIVQYAFSSKHNHYIIWAWKSTERFIHDNTQYINNIKTLANNLLQKSGLWQTQVEMYYSSVLNGLADLVDNKSHIYEIKATKNITGNHILQAFLYSVMSNSPHERENLDIKCRSSLINLIHGEIHHYNFKLPQRVLDDFLESTLNKSTRMLNGTLYLYKIKLSKIEGRLYVYHIWIKEAKSQTNIIDTYIKHPGFTPSFETEEEMNHYKRAPARATVERYLEQIVAKKNKPIFLSVPGCDENGDGLSSLLPANSTIVGGEGFLKLVLPKLQEDKNNKEAEVSNGLDDGKFIVMSDLAFKNLDLLKNYIDEYSISFYI